MFKLINKKKEIYQQHLQKLLKSEVDISNFVYRSSSFCIKPGTGVA